MHPERAQHTPDRSHWLATVSSLALGSLERSTTAKSACALWGNDGAQEPHTPDPQSCSSPFTHHQPAHHRSSALRQARRRLPHHLAPAGGDLTAGTGPHPDRHHPPRHLSSSRQPPARNHEPSWYRLLPRHSL